MIIGVISAQNSPQSTIGGYLVQENYGNFGQNVVFYINKHQGIDNDNSTIDTERNENVTVLDTQYNRKIEYLPLGVGEVFPNLYV